jgi:hypothetical protein
MIDCEEDCLARASGAEGTTAAVIVVDVDE